MIEIPTVMVPSGCMTAKALVPPSASDDEITLALEASYDGGETWLPGGGATCRGPREIPWPFTFGYSAPPTHVRGVSSVDGVQLSFS